MSSYFKPRTPFKLAEVLDRLHHLPDLRNHTGALMLVADLRDEVESVATNLAKGWSPAAREIRRQILSDVL